MSKTSGLWTRLTSALRGRWFIFFVILSYAFFTIYYMGPSTWDCNNTVNGFGDSTAGPIWKNTFDPSSPVMIESKFTNYPFGDPMASPIDAVVIGQSSLIWVTSKIAGPICGFNLVNMIGFVATALVMFGLVYSLSRNRWIAWLAGYAVSFTPFFQVKSGIHAGYGYAAFLIGIIWAFLSLIKTQKISRVFILAALLVVCFYFDPYFSLLAGTILLPLIVTWLILRLSRWNNSESKVRNIFKKEVRLLSLAFGLTALLISPLAYLMLSQKGSIDARTSGTRDNIVEVAKACSNWPHEYLLPFPASPFFEILGSTEKSVKTSLYAFSNCGIAEDAVGIGAGILLIVGIGSLVFIWERVNRRRIGLENMTFYSARLVMYGSIAIIATAFLIALPPAMFGEIPTPSQLLISTTSIWRVLSREYVVLNIAIVIIFSVYLLYFNKVFSNQPRVRLIAFLLLFLSLFLQYQAFKPFSGNEQVRFSYDNVPSAYQWLKDQKAIGAIAEYPIEKATESNSLGYYLTMQSIHMKPLLNSALVTSPQEDIHSSIKNLNDPHTVRVLYSLGVKTVVVHGVDPKVIEAIPYLDVINIGTHSPGSRLPESHAVEENHLVIATIQDMPTIDRSFQFTSKLPLNSSIQTSAVNWQYEIPSGAVFSIQKLRNATHEENVAQLEQSCFDVKMAGKGVESQLIIKNSKTKETVQIENISDNYKKVKVLIPIDQDMIMESVNKHNMRITGIGCNE